MNSGQSSTKLNDMLTEFVDYVYSFYGDKKDALYPLFNVDTDKQVDRMLITSSIRLIIIFSLGVVFMANKSP